VASLIAVEGGGLVALTAAAAAAAADMSKTVSNERSISKVSDNSF
jgi:hypothetical protein